MVAIIDPKTVVIEWSQVYDFLHMSPEYSCEISQLSVLESEDTFVVPVIKQLTLERLVLALEREDSPFRIRIDQVDYAKIKHDRDPRNGSYTVAFHRGVSLASQSSANRLEMKWGILGATLLEEILLEIGYFMATRQHLDAETYTLCPGSRDQYGQIGIVDWCELLHGLYIDWRNPNDDPAEDEVVRIVLHSSANAMQS